MRCGGAVRALALWLALALWAEGPRAQGASWEGAPPAAGLRWALAGAGAGAGGGGGRAVGVVDLGDGPRWLPALHARAAAPLLLWRAPPNPAVGCAPYWLEGARGYVLAASGARRLVHFLVRDTSEAVWSQMYGFITGNLHRNMQLDSAVPIVMAISTKALEENGCLQNIAGSQYYRANHSARGIVQFGARSPPSGALRLERGSEEESRRGREEWAALQALRWRHQSFRGVVLREDAAGATWRATAFDPATGRKRVYKWKSGGDEDGVEGELASAALLAARSPGPTDISVRAVVLTESGYANFTESFGGVKVQVVGHFHRLLEEMRKRLRFAISLSEITTRDFITGQQVAGNMEKMVVTGEIDLVPQYIKYVTTTLGSSTLMDIVSSGEFNQHIVLVPFASPLPAWSLPLRVFSPRIWLALLGTAVAYALAWCMVAGASLAGAAAATLRAFSSCGGAPQDRVRATPQRLQLAAALLASAVIVAAVYQVKPF
ncbi:hypothetical protein R5R35_010221 [Gryllus longicercus]|uniref:Ionotropic receptor n=1 Tax=Gryllus longicercus TaxID=2509291 RepID=A0AAN9VTY7_9ORTH